MAPKLSVIIPTRERSDTLRHTLRTLVEQDYLDCEFIVSDNDSQDDTKQVVESFSDPRICYINTGRRVSMADNWEFALRHARGSYITYIGDDDGFIPGALTKAIGILEMSQMNALVWGKSEYCWPDYIDESMRNWFSIKNKSYTLRVADGHKKLNQVINFREAYTWLPCLYNGIVKMSLIEELRAQSTNEIFFNAISPDVFSGIVLSTVVDKYLCTDYPFSVNGASRHSNGTSFMRQRTDDERESPSAKFNAENQRKYDPRIQLGPSTLICVMGEYLLAKQFLPALYLPGPSWSHYVSSLAKSAKKAFLPREVLQSAAHTAKQLGLKVRATGKVERTLNRPPPVIGFIGDSFNFIAPRGMVENIYDACRLVAGMLSDVSAVEYSSPINIFVKRIKDCLVIELKSLYRSF